MDYSDCRQNEAFRVQQFKMHAGIGTHMDAPAHCIPSSTTIDQIPLSQLIAPCVVLDVSSCCHERYSLSLKDIIEHFEEQYGMINEGSFVLIKTGWEKFWGDPENYSNNHFFPSISVAAAEILIKLGVCGLGIDTLSLDRSADGFPVHKLFLGNGKYIVENVANLANLPVTGSCILALPIKVRGATEAPITYWFNKRRNKLKFLEGIMKKLILYLSIGLLFNTSSLADTKCFLVKENDKIIKQEGDCASRYALVQYSKLPLV